MAFRFGKSVFLAIMLFIAFHGFGSAIRAADKTVEKPLTILYFEREPYYYTQADGKRTGFLMEITTRILKRARIPYHFAEVPSKRILSMIQTQGTFCSPGWFKNPERETYARFSDPIYQNKPLKMVIRKDLANKLPSEPTLSAVLSQPMTIGLVDGYSYGSWADGLIKRNGTKQYRLTGAPAQVYNMVALGRIDFTLASPEEATYLINNNKEFKEKLTIVNLSDAPAGNHRYLIYSRAVSPSVVDRVDKALASFKNTEEYRNLTHFTLQDNH